ncbi:hypothetical protein Barb7_00422 [Bacteroidales bacterium Barb7]|nr:hypothetical protein Barb7_00422 [Bacteroidales bacterium Barb7]
MPLNGQQFQLACKPFAAYNAIDIFDDLSFINKSLVQNHVILKLICPKIRRRTFPHLGQPKASDGSRA